MRIQRKRTKGWLMPDGAVYVGRPTSWGNPFSVQTAREFGYCDGMSDLQAKQFVVDVFEEWLRLGELSEYWLPNSVEQWCWIRSNVHKLQGKQIACWCSLDDPCHADVLVELSHQATGFVRYDPIL